MGVAVAGAACAAGFAVFEAAKAGITVGPSAVVKVSRNASVFLGASGNFSFLNIRSPPLCRKAFELRFFRTRIAARIEGLDPGERTISSKCFSQVATRLKECESGGLKVGRDQRTVFSIASA